MIIGSNGYKCMLGFLEAIITY